MKVWRVNRFGHYSTSLHLEKTAEPVPDTDAVLVEVSTAGINFPDLLMIAGSYQVRPSLPFVPGFEAVGVVAQSPNPSLLNAGDRVVCWTETGAYAERICIPTKHVLKLSPKLTDTEGAAYLISYHTAYLALTHRTNLKAGETLLITAAAGALGTALIQIGKALGARVLACASSPSKLSFALSSGADQVFNQEADLIGQIRDITGGHGVDVVIDMVGGQLFSTLLKCLAFEGRIIPLGFTSGDIPAVKMNYVLLKNIVICGLYWSQYWHQRPEIVHEADKALTTLIDSERIRPRVSKVFPMEDLPAALAMLEHRQALGKLVLNIR